MKLFFAYWLIVFLLLSANANCGGTRIMSEENIQGNNPPTEKVEIPELEKFIFRTDIFEAEIVPRKLAPEKVAQFLLEKVDANTNLKAFVQVEKVAAFYETFEIAGKFRQFLGKKESGVEDVRRSIVITRIIARVGLPEDVNFARDYYKYLVGRAEGQAEFEDLILLYAALGANADILHQKIQTVMSSLEAKKESDEVARVQYLELAGTVTNKLKRAEKAQLVKARILAIEDRKKRVEAEMKAYLTIEYGYTEYMESWAAGRLRRETWGAQPAEQIKRTDNTQLKSDIAKLFDDFLKKIDELPDLEPEEKEFAKIRTLRAIKFFGGKISDSEEVFLNEHKNEQIDILANEGFMIKNKER